MKGQTTCRCGCGMDITLSMRGVLTAIEQVMQAELGQNYELTIDSGARCLAYNTEIGGAWNSAHTVGQAADIALGDSHERFVFLRAAFTRNIRRIEDRLLNHGYCHIDIATGAVPRPNDTSKEYPQDVYIVLP